MCPLPESADFQGEIETFGSIGTAYLFADENRLYLRAPFIRYQFTPSEVVTLEESGERGVAIQHTRPDYPEKIVFNSSDNSSTEMLLAIASKSFTPCASSNDIPTREDSLPIRDDFLIGVIVLGMLLFFMAIIVSISRTIFQVNIPLVEVGSWSATISLLTIFLVLASIRFCPPIQWLLVKPGRSLSELGPSILDNFVIVFGLLAVSNFLVHLGIPEILAVGIDFLLFLAIVQIDLRLLP
jgi:hypothetical protein